MRVGTKGWCTPPNIKMHAADGAARFKRKAIAAMKLVSERHLEARAGGRHAAV